MSTGVGDHGCADDTGELRQHQEDGSFMDPRAGLFAVFDGMGGQSSGEFAVLAATRRLEERAGAWSIGGDHVASVRALMAELHQAVLDSHPFSNSGWMTTATLASFWGGWCVIGHVGDTRAYLARDGALTPLTREHGVLELFLARREYTDDELDPFRYRDVLTRMMGMRDAFEVDLKLWRWRAGDRLILCSDGLYDAVPGELLARIACDPMNTAQDTADALVWAAIDARTRDNVCVVVVDADATLPEGRPWAPPARARDPFGELRSALHAHDAQGWARVVAALESTRDDPGEHARLLEYATSAIRGWPKGVRRPTPPCWLTGTWGGAPRPELALCDTLCLPDAWAPRDDAWLEWVQQDAFAHMAHPEPGWGGVAVSTLRAFGAFARTHRPGWVGAIEAELSARADAADAG